MALSLDALGLATRIVGVVSSAAPACALSIAAGRPVVHPTTTRLADAWQQRAQLAGQRTALVLSGGRVDRDVFAAVLSDTEPA